MARFINGKKLFLIASVIALVILQANYIFAFNTAGEKNNLIQQDQEKKDSWTEVDKISQKEIPYSATTVDKPGAGKVSAANDIKETVIGLKNIGYSTNEIVAMLKNGNKNATEISIACLNADIRGEEIHSALTSAGFSTQIADNAVPAAIRGTLNKQDNAASEAQNSGNSAGPNFSGLGDWNRFQERRYNFLRGGK